MSADDVSASLKRRGSKLAGLSDVDTALLSCALPYFQQMNTRIATVFPMCKPGTTGKIPVGPTAHAQLHRMHSMPLICTTYCMQATINTHQLPVMETQLKYHDGTPIRVTMTRYGNRSNT